MKPSRKLAKELDVAVRAAYDKAALLSVAVQKELKAGKAKSIRKLEKDLATVLKTVEDLDLAARVAAVLAAVSSPPPEKSKSAMQESAAQTPVVPAEPVPVPETTPKPADTAKSSETVEPKAVPVVDVPIVDVPVVDMVESVDPVIASLEVPEVADQTPNVFPVRTPGKPRRPEAPSTPARTPGKTNAGNSSPRIAGTSGPTVKPGTPGKAPQKPVGGSQRPTKASTPPVRKPAAEPPA